LIDGNSQTRSGVKVCRRKTTTRTKRLGVDESTTRHRRRPGLIGARRHRQNNEADEQQDNGTDNGTNRQRHDGGRGDLLVGVAVVTVAGDNFIVARQPSLTRHVSTFDQCDYRFTRLAAAQLAAYTRYRTALHARTTTHQRY